jgi:hypothetical protein
MTENGVAQHEGRERIEPTGGDSGPRHSGEAAQPESTGASRLATLNEVTGPKRRVIGDSTAAGASQLVLDITLTPPRRDHMALVKKGSWPWVNAQGSHSNHHTCCTVSPQLHVME